MALKGDRWVIYADTTYNMNEVATRGGCVSFKTGGSGAALDQSQALCTYAANQSGAIPLGILLNDMVNYDLTRQHINWHKDEVQKGGKVSILMDGWCVTNSIQPGDTPTAGATAYLEASGNLTHTAVNGVNNPTVGQFLSTPDELNYCKVAVKLPT